METVKISQVIPDKNQPRKLFAPERLANLRKSVEKHGILNPIIVEKQKDGKYLIVDGERRYRVAADLGKKEVPIVAIDPQSEMDRIIQQFHIQEQHEGWTATEKAKVISTLADELGIPLREACAMLGISGRNGERYIAFLRLADQKSFEEAKIDVEWAQRINNLKNIVRSIYHNVLEEEFITSEEKKLENAVISRVKEGTMVKNGDITKLKDSFIKDPKTIKSFIESNVTPEGLFIKTKAKGAYHLRNVRNSSGYVSVHANRFMEIGDVKVDQATMYSAKQAYKVLKTFISKYDDLVE